MQLSTHKYRQRPQSFSLTDLYPSLHFCAHSGLMSTSLEHVLHLFDSIWFHDRAFVMQCNSNQQKGRHEFSSREEEEHEKSQLESANILNIRSHSDHFLMSSGSIFSSDSQSPTSVLPSPKLQTIFSGKEVAAGFDKLTSKHDYIVRADAAAKPDKRKNSNRQRKLQGRNRKGSSKSLTELEFEELKGFKDLGFVFSEDDCDDADLVSIVPGLQRLRRRSDSLDVERPYLSEAWGVMEKKEALLKPATLIINHKFRQVDMENELVMKEQIKSWAHYVATAIR